MYKFGSKAEVPLLTSNKKWRQCLTGLVLFSSRLVSRKVFSVLHLSEKPHQVSSARASQWVLAHNAQGEGGGGAVETSSLREGSDYSSGISMTSSSMMSPCGTAMSSGDFLQLIPEKGLHQESENGPPNAIRMASPQEIFPHFPVSPFRRSIPCEGQNTEGLRWKDPMSKKWNPKTLGRFFLFFFILTCTTVTQGAQLKLHHHHGLTGWACFLDNNET